MRRDRGGNEDRPRARYETGSSGAVLSDAVAYSMAFWRTCWRALATGGRERMMTVITPSARM